MVKVPGGRRAHLAVLADVLSRGSARAFRAIVDRAEGEYDRLIPKA